MTSLNVLLPSDPTDNDNIMIAISNSPVTSHFFPFPFLRKDRLQKILMMIQFPSFDASELI